MINNLRIFGKKITIKTGPLLHDEQSCGSYQGMRSRIEIDPAAEAQDQGTTLVHEIVECVNRELGLRVPHEALTQIAIGLYAVLRDNPDVAKHIIASRRIVE